MDIIFGLLQKGGGGRQWCFVDAPHCSPSQTLSNVSVLQSLETFFSLLLIYLISKERGLIPILVLAHEQCSPVLCSQQCCCFLITNIIHDYRTHRGTKQPTAQTASFADGSSVERRRWKAAIPSCDPVTRSNYITSNQSPNLHSRPLSKEGQSWLTSEEARKLPRDQDASPPTIEPHSSVFNLRSQACPTYITTHCVHFIPCAYEWLIP